MKYFSGKKRLKFKNGHSLGDLHISPYHLGKLGGQMAQVMMRSAQDFLAREVAKEVQKTFRETISQQIQTERSNGHPH